MCFSAPTLGQAIVGTLGPKWSNPVGHMLFPPGGEAGGGGGGGGLVAGVGPTPPQAKSEMPDRSNFGAERGGMGPTEEVAVMQSFGYNVPSPHRASIRLPAPLWPPPPINFEYAVNEMAWFAARPEEA